MEPRRSLATRAAIASRIHAICWDRHLDHDSSIDTATGCRMEPLLVEVVRLAEAVGPNDFAAFESAIPRTICLQCGQQDALGRCRDRDRAECGFHRDLPLIYDAIHEHRW